MVQPESFIKKGKQLVCWLNKSMYGLKQASRCWYKQFDFFIMSLGFDRLEAAYCAYFCGYDDGSFYILLFYVDDMMVAGNSKSRISNLKTQLTRKFEMKNLGVMNQILRMKMLWERKDGKIWLLQKKICGEGSAVLQHVECKAGKYPISYLVKTIGRAITQHGSGKR